MSVSQKRLNEFAALQSKVSNKTTSHSYLLYCMHNLLWFEANVQAGTKPYSGGAGAPEEI